MTQYTDKLRPTSFKEFIGQEDAKSRLSIAIEASKRREQPLPHVLLGGSAAGIGKTSLAFIIANERGVKATYVNAPGIKKPGELINIFTKINKNEIVIVDEIHAINKSLSENLLPLMEDFRLTINLFNREAITIDINPFTLIACTTEIGKLLAPLRDRFEIPFALQPYNDSEIAQIVSQSLHKLELTTVPSVVANIANRARGVPRIANRLVKRVRDYALIYNDGSVTDDIVEAAMQLEKIDAQGLSEVDKKYLKVLQNNYGGGPCGLGTLALTIGEDEVTVRDYIEPFLIRKSFISVTKQGRVLTRKGTEFVLGIGT